MPKHVVFNGGDTIESAGDHAPLAFSDKRKEAIICLGAGLQQLPIIKAAKKIGYAAIAIDQNPKAIGFKSADVSINISTYDHVAILQALEEITNIFLFVGVLARTTAHEAQFSAIQIRKIYGLRGVTEELLRITTSKKLLREFLKRKCIRTPIGHEVDGINENKPLKFPVIIKPDITVVGKKGIMYCPDLEALKANRGVTQNYSGNGRAEVQEFVEGIDVSCLVKVSDGLAEILLCWDELVGIDSELYIRGLGVSIPSIIDRSVYQDKIVRILKVLSEFSDVDSLVVVSFRINTEGEANVIELHTDLVGDLVADHLLPASSPEFDFFHFLIDFSVGLNLFNPKCNFSPTLLYFDISSGRGESNEVQKKHNIIRLGSNRLNLIEFNRRLQLLVPDMYLYPEHCEWQMIAK